MDDQNPQTQQSGQTQSTQDQTLEERIKSLQQEQESEKNKFNEESQNADANLGDQSQQTTQDPKDELIEKLQKELEEMKSMAIRATADYQNLRKRAEDEKIEFVKFSNARLMLEIIPFVDNMKRAITHLPEDLKSNDWVQGVINIEKQFTDTLTKQGLQKIETNNQKFDANLHEALMQMPGEKDIILQEIEEGYMLNGKMIRPTKVIVGNGEIEPEIQSQS